VRIIFTASGSTERRPSRVLTRIGKKTKRPTRRIFGPMPKPS
jgi:hypothetical protein